MTRARIVRTAREVALTSTAIVGALCLVVVVAGLAFGVRPLLFRSGSMAPTIHTGDLSLSRTVDADALKPGDIVSVLTPSGTRVTHRVVTNTATGAKRQLQLKGDANRVVDNQVYDVAEAQKVFLTIPKMGYVVAWFSHAPGSYVLAMYVALMLLLMARRPDPESNPGAGTGTRPRPEGRRRIGEPKGAPAGKRRRLRVVAPMVAVGTALMAAVVPVSGWGMSTWASWTDMADVSGTTFASGTWGGPVAPAVSCSVVGSNGNWKIKLDWTYGPPDPSTKFVVRSAASGTNPAVVPGTPVDVAKTLRTWTSSGFTNKTGEIWVVAVEGATEVASDHLNYSFGPGSGNGNKNCPSS